MESQIINIQILKTEFFALLSAFIGIILPLTLVYLQQGNTYLSFYINKKYRLLCHAKWMIISLGLMVLSYIINSIYNSRIGTWTKMIEKDTTEFIVALRILAISILVLKIIETLCFFGKIYKYRGEDKIHKSLILYKIVSKEIKELQKKNLWEKVNRKIDKINQNNKNIASSETYLTNIDFTYLFDQRVIERINTWGLCKKNVYYHIRCGSVLDIRGQKIISYKNTDQTTKPQMIYMILKNLCIFQLFSRRDRHNVYFLISYISFEAL